jgi:hypothetical protein
MGNKPSVHGPINTSKFERTYFIPIFGFPCHVRSFIYSANAMTTNEPLFGIFALSPFTQQIHSKYTNQRILDCFHHDYYRIADDLLVRSHHCEAHDDVGPTPIENRTSSNPP